MSRGYSNCDYKRDCGCKRDCDFSCRSNYCHSPIPSCCGDDRFGFFNKYGYGTGNNNSIFIILIVIAIFFFLGKQNDDDD